MSLGSNGFSQLGDSRYYEKSLVEMEVLLPLFRARFPIPDCLAGYVSFGTKTFSHEAGLYTEVVLYLTADMMGMEYSDDENENDLFIDYFTFMQQIEAFDVESDIITGMIKSRYLAGLDLSKSEHLQLIGGIG